MKKKFKVVLKDLKCNGYNLKEGDIVETDDGTEMYIILKVKYTILHNHKYYKVFYLNSDSYESAYETWFAEEMKKIKNVKRLVKEEICLK